MLPKRRKPEPMGLRESRWIRCPSHLKWIRGFTCVIAGLEGHECEGRIEAMHVRTGTDGAMGEKPSDIWAIPGCEAAHRLQHQIGEPAFERRFKIDMKAKARAFAKASPHRHRWESQE